VLTGYPTFIAPSKNNKPFQIQNFSENVKNSKKSYLVCLHIIEYKQSKDKTVMLVYYRA